MTRLAAGRFVLAVAMLCASAAGCGSGVEPEPWTAQPRCSLAAHPLLYVTVRAPDGELCYDSAVEAVGDDGSAVLDAAEPPSDHTHVGIGGYSGGPVLGEGLYDITVTKDGYAPVSLEDVMVGECNVPTHLDVDLGPPV